MQCRACNNSKEPHDPKNSWCEHVSRAGLALGILVIRLHYKNLTEAKNYRKRRRGRKKHLRLQHALIRHNHLSGASTSAGDDPGTMSMSRLRVPGASLGADTLASLPKRGHGRTTRLIAG